MSNILNWKCSKCGESCRRSIFMALMIDAGAKTDDPVLCPKGGDHDFVDLAIPSQRLQAEG